MEARYRYRLRVTPGQARQLQAVFDTCRYVWNTALGRWEDVWRQERISLSAVEMQAQLTAWRSCQNWLAAVPVTPQQQTIRDLGKAISAFFDKKNPARRPTFKRKGSHATGRWTTRGFRVTGTGTGEPGDRLAVAVAGGRAALRVVWSRPLPSAPKSVTVYRDPAGRWWASFVVRVNVEHLDATGRTTGVDVGLTTLATTCDPAFDVANPRFSRQERQMLASWDRRLSRAQRGSGRSAKAKAKRARAYSSVAARRADHAHKTARTIARSFDRVGAEDLRVKNLLANRRLARAIADAGWGQWLAILAWQLRKAGRELELFDPRNTTQTCSNCGTKAKSRLRLGDRTFRCDDCGLVLDRDRNAAHNLDPGRAGPGVGVDGTKPWPSAENQAA
jgi:putative transposase